MADNVYELRALIGTLTIEVTEDIGTTRKIQGLEEGSVLDEVKDGGIMKTRKGRCKLTNIPMMMTTPGHPAGRDTLSTKETEVTAETARVVVSKHQRMNGKTSNARNGYLNVMKTMKI